MTDIQIPSINFSNNRIQKCSVVIDKNSFNVEYKDGKYVVTKGDNKVTEVEPQVVSEKEETQTSSVNVEKTAENKKNATEKKQSKVDKSTDKSTDKTNVKPPKKGLGDGISKDTETINKQRLGSKLSSALKSKKTTGPRELTKEEKVMKELKEKLEKRNKAREEKTLKYEKYNQMKKVRLPEGAIRLEMSKDGIEEKEIENYFKSEEYKEINPST